MSPRLPALGLAVASALVSAIAEACPACAAGQSGGAGRMVLVGLMIAAPYVAATVVIRVIRKGEAEASAADADARR